MQDFIYILEQLEKLNIEDRLEKLSKKFQDKNVVIFGANTAFKAISSKYDLTKYFKITGICDEHFTPESTFEFTNFKIIPLFNLYFSGADVVINLKNDFKNIEKSFRKNHYIKKKVKFVNLLEKSLLEKSVELINKTKLIYNEYTDSKNIISACVDFFKFDLDKLTIKYNYARKCREIQNSDKPIRVLFLAHDNNQWTLTKLYNTMKEDSSFKMLPILILPNSLSNETVSKEETIKYFNENGMEALEGFEYETQTCPMVEALKPDVIFYQQPEFLKSNYTPTKMSNYALTCYVENELALDNQAQYQTPYMQYCISNTWKVFTAHNFNGSSDINKIFAGYTKFDNYEPKDVEETSKLWNISSNDIDNKIVYVPSFTINENFNINEHLEQLNYMLEFASYHPQYSFVVIPHKELVNRYTEIGLAEQYNQYFMAWQSLPNAIIADYKTSLDVFSACDVLITDNLNTISDFLISEKPVVYLENSNTKDFNEFGEKIYKTLYKAKSNDAIEIILEDLLVNKNDYNYQDRYSTLMKNNSKFTKNSAELIVEDLKSNLIKIEYTEDEEPKEQEETNPENV